jgi:hypothetical protein
MDIAPERLTDYLRSAVQFMMTEDPSAHDTLSDCIGREVMRGPCTDVIAFCASIVTKESDKEWDKRRYYSVSQMKIGKSRNLEFDKRYSEVPTWADGSAESIFRLMYEEHRNGFTAYTYAYNVREWCLDNKKYCPLPGDLMGWFRDDTAQDRALRESFYAARSFAQGRNMLHIAKNSLEDYTRNLARLQEEIANAIAA